jgi:hypothetical protein
MVGRLVLVASLGGIAWLRWGRIHRCPCGAEFSNRAALADHMKHHRYE